MGYASRMSMRSVFFATTLRPSVTWKVTRYLPALVGVPLRTPSVGSKRIPFGSGPFAIFHLRGRTPPVEATFARYRRPTLPGRSASVLTASRAATPKFAA